ncbi:hypothetical protein CVT24_006624 [Panaeolus cyanescens]|uniref:Epoxide hydrolase N-terminal domain-containing protein n=1 Tax=Panaeolus cyanescens TaxID=181874 RepID=A0A409YSA0_9AGAR|nr:hypothetical protein CVT24_006624 [Panaeolus cyanescens]
MSNIAATSFVIDIPQERLDLLQRKLDLAELPDELEAAGWDYGVPLSDVKRLLSHWKTKYDWKKHEAALNTELPQFKRPISVDGFGSLGIHYVHKRSKLESAIPLLFIHGWPGSFVEVQKLLPLLTDAPTEYPNFHVVALSLPGYGFSDAPTKKGFTIQHYAEVGHKLMLSLGYVEYVAQGGDWGHVIAKDIAYRYGPQHAKAWHTNLPTPEAYNYPPTPFSSPGIWFSSLFTKYTEAEKAGLQRTMWFRQAGRGYFMQQATQPQTLGYSLADSPVGLLAWVYEKLVNWTDAYPWTDDEVLTWISIYWFSTAGPAASVRIYYESSQAQPEGVPSIPRGVSFFPKDIYRVPKAWVWGPDLVFEAEHESGGHFAAHEKPDLLAGDLRKMFGKGGPAFGVVQGRTGYASS